MKIVNLHWRFYNIKIYFNVAKIRSLFLNRQENLPVWSPAWKQGKNGLICRYINDKISGYCLPVQFPQGIIKEHLHCR
jgi:hypothetical protein